MQNVLDLAQGRVSLKKASADCWKGPCPECGDSGKGQRSNKFHVWPDDREGGSYWCRACDKKGDAIQFLIDFDGLTYPEACDRLGVDRKTRRGPFTPTALKRHVPAAPVPSGFSGEAKRHPAEVIDPDLWREKATKFAAACHQKLLAMPDRLAWLARRGVSAEAVALTRLGWNERAEFRPWSSWGLRDDKKPDGRPVKLVLPAGLVVPSWSGAQASSLRVRLAEPDPRDPDKKYHLVKGSCPGTYALGVPSDVYVIVETLLDAIACFMAGRELGVGAMAMASSHTKPDDVCTAALRSARKILNALDLDHAGTGASAWWKSNFTNSFRWPPPSGLKDPGEAAEHGEDLRKWIFAGLPGDRIAEALKEKGEGAPPEKIHMDKQDEQDKSHESSCPPCPSPKAPTLAMSDGSVSPLDELHALLMAHPVAIDKTHGGLGLRFAHRWEHKNWDVFSRLSHLVFWMDECWRYLMSHPDRRITGKNLWG
jgi:hypothetical protein